MRSHLNLSHPFGETSFPRRFLYTACTYTNTQTKQKQKQTNIFILGQNTYILTGVFWEGYHLALSPSV